MTLQENLELASDLREQHERYIRTEASGLPTATLYLMAAEAIEALVAQLQTASFSNTP